MHELPATQGMLDVALEAAHDAGAVRIVAIDVVVGELTSIVDDSVQFYFDVLSRGTAAAGAQLRLRRVPGSATCAACQATYAVVPPLTATCRSCGSLALSVRGGRDFRIDSIEVDG